MHSVTCVHGLQRPHGAQLTQPLESPLVGPLEPKGASFPLQSEEFEAGQDLKIKEIWLFFFFFSFAVLGIESRSFALSSIPSPSFAVRFELCFSLISNRHIFKCSRNEL